MTVILILARILLSGVFALSGTTKLLDPDGSRSTMGDFGVPAQFQRAAAWGLPVAELIVAIGLLPAATARWAAIGAIALLAIFVAAIARSLAKGQTPDCHCFGQLHSAPVSWWTVARNGALIALSGLVVSNVGRDAVPGLTSPLSSLSTVEKTLLATQAGTLIILGGLAWVIYELMVQHGQMLERLDLLAPGTHADVSAATPAQPRVLGLEVGAPAPMFELDAIDGSHLSLDALRQAHGTILLLFVNPGCGACSLVLQEVKEWQRLLNHWARIVPISRGDVDANREVARRNGLDMLLIQQDREVARAYGAPRTPAAVLVHADGTIGSPVAVGPDEIRTLLFPEEHEQKPEPVNTFTALTSIDGDTVHLADLLAHGLPTLLIFTDPLCEPCQAILPDVARWQRDYADRVTVAVISRGTVEANRKHLAPHEISTVLLQKDMEVIEAFRLVQAPSLVVLQPDGVRVGDAINGDIAIRMRVAAIANAPELRAAPGTDLASMATVIPEQLVMGDPVPDDLRAEIGPSIPADRDAILLFWSPTCGYCRRMIDDVITWEQHASPDAPSLVLITSSPESEVRKDGITSAVIADPQRKIAHRFGSHGTPSAMRIEPNGRVVRPMASGIHRVRDMLAAASVFADVSAE